jgi:predicted dehydrogenase
MTKIYTAAVIGLSAEIGQERPKLLANLPWSKPIPRSHVAAYETHPRTELMAVCDLMPNALALFEKQWRDDLPKTRTYTHYPEMIAECKPDMLSVVTPDDKHADIVVYAAEHGVRAIFCEKPIATTLADADRMIAACAAHGTLLAINHTRRYGTIFQSVRAMLREGTFGKLHAIYSHMNLLRAMLFRNGTHFIDMMCFLADAPVQWLSAELESGFETLTQYAGDGGRNPASEPAGHAYFHFANGVRGTLNLNKVRNTRSYFELVCDDAIIEVDDKSVHIVRSTAGGNYSREQLALPRYQTEYETAALSELVYMLDNKMTNPQFIQSNGSTARHTLAIMLAMLTSNAEGNRLVAL